MQECTAFNFQIRLYNTNFWILHLPNAISSKDEKYFDILKHKLSLKHWGRSTAAIN